jgi:hypothetical protein
MQDIIFGALISDELKLVHHRSGPQHNYAIEPLNPKPDQPVAIFALVGADINLDEVVCYYARWRSTGRLQPYRGRTS